jgi:hypothetical protein
MILPLLVSLALSHPPALEAKRASAKELASLPDLTKAVCATATVVPEQSFRFAAGGPHGEALLLSVRCDDKGLTRTRFVELRKGQVAQVLDHPANAWNTEDIEGVAFQDINGDGVPDLVAVVSAMTGIGPTGAVPFSVVGIWLGQTDGSWKADPEGNAFAGALKTHDLGHLLPALVKHYAKR